MRRPLLALALVATLAAAAHANGRFPRSVKVEFQPGRPATAILGMTFGVLVTKDDGATWRWVCESAIGFEGTFDPDYEVSSSGALFATTYRGLRVNRDGCLWEPPVGEVGTTSVSSMAIASNGTVWVGTSDEVLGSALFRSTDDGRTFTRSALVGMPGDYWNTIEVVPGDPQRIVVTAYRLVAGMPRERLLYRSADGGVTWEGIPTAALIGTNRSDLMVAAIDPANPNRVYLRLTNIGMTIQEAVYRTENFWTMAPGGPSWTKVLDVPDRITEVVVRANGDVLATTPSQGLFRSTDDGATFATVPGVQYDAWCLKERPGGELWMCTNNLPPDNASIVVSTDATTWQPKLTYAQITGPVRCAAGTSQREDCEVLLWCGLKENLGILSNEIDCAGPEVDAGIDATGPGGGGKSCCSTGRGPGGELVVVAMALLVRRRRRGGRVAR